MKPQSENPINQHAKSCPEFKKSIFKRNCICDGFHTFDELYEHRIRLFISLCEFFIQGKPIHDNRNVWKSWLHSDGSRYYGWFVMGIGKEFGNQITYHLPSKYWEECDKFTETLEKAPEYDGHTSEDVLERLKNLYQWS